MTGRLLPSLCCFLLLLCAQGVGLHVHWHQHGEQALHSHVASVLDADHAEAHVQGGREDRDQPSGAARLPLPDLVLVAGFLSYFFAEPPAAAPLPRQDVSLATGPPRHRRPPGQAPPEFLLIL